LISLAVDDTMRTDGGEVAGRVVAWYSACCDRHAVPMLAELSYCPRAARATPEAAY